MTKIQKEQHWRELVEKQEQSGLSIRAFCLQENISSGSWYKWRQRLRELDLVKSEHQDCHESSGLWRPLHVDIHRPQHEEPEQKNRASDSVRHEFEEITNVKSSDNEWNMELSLPYGIVLRIRH